jgi:hypothetical protein
MRRFIHLLDHPATIWVLAALSYGFILWVVYL